MGQNVITRTVVIQNAAGLHVRPADMFVKLASQFQSTIRIKKDHEQADGKSILELLTLAAVEGTQLSLEAEGDDAAEALEALAQLVEQNFNEE